MTFEVLKNYFLPVLTVASALNLADQIFHKSLVYQQHFLLAVRCIVRICKEVSRHRGYLVQVCHLMLVAQEGNAN